ncbi:MAG TPA: hypothetical protein VFW56_08415, partial [Bradyrhizobium sp.]|nr:hypothetical protein [Bradyrhizobium sp.]
MNAQIQVVWRQRPFVGDLRCRSFDVASGAPTIAAIVAGIPAGELPRGFDECGEVRINGDVIDRRYWHCVRPRYRPGFDTVVSLHVPLQGGGGSGGSSGGKNTLALVASIAVLLVAAAVSGGTLFGPAVFGGL